MARFRRIPDTELDIRSIPSKIKVSLEAITFPVYLFLLPYIYIYPDVDGNNAFGGS